MINELKRMRRRLERTEREVLWNAGTASNEHYRSEQTSYAAGLRRAIQELTDLLAKIGEDQL